MFCSHFTCINELVMIFHYCLSTPVNKKSLLKKLLVNITNIYYLLHTRHCTNHSLISILILLTTMNILCIV